MQIEGMTDAKAAEMVERVGFHPACVDQAKEIINKLYKLFIDSDCTMVEINPMAEDVNGKGDQFAFMRIVYRVFF